jgi:cobyrinic acid a,c-diamide synthase
MTPGFLIAGTNSGVGKTTVSTGIMYVLSEEMNVQPFKTGPDYIDPAYHTFITGKKSRNLDTWINSENIIKYLYSKNAKDADMAVVEGVMGLYDSKEIGEKKGSTAYLAEVLNLPTLLIVDGKGMAGSAAAIVKGYAELDPKSNVKGVIFNNVGGMHYQLLKDAVEKFTHVKAYGYIEKLPEIELPSRHLGLVPSCEIDNLKEQLNVLRDRIKNTVDFQGLIELANTAGEIEFEDINIEKKEAIRIGIAKDSAFNFYYEDNIDLLKEMGAELIEFSPLESKLIPNNLHLLLFGGGFPEVFAKDLQNNHSIREDLRAKLQEGIPYLSECGGMMYLCDEIVDFNGDRYEMTGYLKGYTEMTKKLQRFGYATIRLEEDCIYGKAGDQIRIHEFHRSKDHVDEKKVFHVHKDRKGKVSKEWECGYVKGKGASSYAHFHYYSNLEMIKSVYDKAVEYKNNCESR